MSKADEAEKILAWVLESPAERVAEGTEKVLALGVDIGAGGPDGVRVASVGQSLFMLSEASKLSH